MGDEIWIDLNSGDKGEGLALNTFAHEMYHHVEKWNQKGAQTLAEFVVKELGLKDVKSAVDAQIQKATAAGYGVEHFKSKGMTEEQAINTVEQRAMSDFVADSLETMFSRGDAPEAIARLKQEDRGLFDKIKEFVDQWVSTLKDWYSDKTISREGKQVAQLERFEELQKLFMEAVAEAGENYRAAEVTNKKSTTGETDENTLYSIRNNIKDVNGNVYSNVVELEYKTFNKIRKNTKAYIDFIRNNLIKQKITVYDSNGEPEIIEFAKTNERVQKDGTSNFRRVLGELERAHGDVKKLTITNAEEVAEISEIKNHSTENSHQWLDQNGWDERWSYVMTQDGMIYPIILHIAKTRDGRNLLYSVNVDITKGIGIDKGATSAQAGKQAQQAVKIPTPSITTVSQPESIVKDEMNSLRNAPEDLHTVRRRLADAFDSIASTVPEKNWAAEYREKIAQAETIDSNLKITNRQIQEKTQSKNPADKKGLGKLKGEATRMQKDLDKLNRRIHFIESLKSFRDTTSTEAKAYGKSMLQQMRNQQKESLQQQLLENRVTREELTGMDSDITIMEKEFIRIAKAYEKLDAINMEVRDGEQCRKTYEANLLRYDQQIAAETDPAKISGLIEKRNEYAAKGDQFANRVAKLKEAYYLPTTAI